MITIFTPTYNRAHTLPALFSSLMQQTCFDFEWLIVDDGSTDNTKDIVMSFNSDHRFPIRYHKKPNEGKHVAINFAARIAKGDWFFIVDSDDTLPPKAIDTIVRYCNSIVSDASFAGVAGLKAHTNGHSIGNSFQDRFVDATSIELRYRMNILGDKAEVIRTDLIKQYPFKSFPCEPFMQESVLWLSVARDGYRFRWFNEVVYLADYIEDGLTKNGRAAARKSCLSRSYADNHITSIHSIPFKNRLKSSINYYRYGVYGKKTYTSLFQESHDKWLSIISIPIAFLTHIRQEAD